MKRTKPVFGRLLKEVYKENHDQLPEVFTESIAILRDRGLNCQGLFSWRQEGRKAKLLEKAWDMGRNPLKAASFTDCYAVADSLLMWLKALPAPVIPCRLFRAFLATRQTSCQAESLAELHLLFSQMEECEVQTLELLLGFLHDYQQAQRQHSFATPILGQIFAPVLLRGSEGPLPLPFPEDVKAAASLVNCMIDDFTAVFSLQPQCTTASHKPPSGAKRQKWSTREHQTDRQGRGGIARDLSCAGGAGVQQRFAASAPVAPAPVCSRELPVKHLRVNVVAPLLEIEENSRNESRTREGSLPTPHSCHPFAPPEPSARDWPAPSPLRMATISESSSLASTTFHAEPELEVVLDQLLCGSMENLFTDNQSYFDSAASSTGSPRCSTGNGGTSSSNSSNGDGDVTEVSSDEDMLGGEVSPPLTPSRRAVHPSYQPHLLAL